MRNERGLFSILDRLCGSKCMGELCILILLLVEKNRMAIVGGEGSDGLNSWIL